MQRYAMIPTSMHEYSRRVEFADTDAAGVVHFSRLLCFVEEAEHDWMRTLSLDPFPPGEGWPRIGAEVRYLAPAHFQDVLQVGLSGLVPRQRGLNYDFCVTRESDGMAICRGTMQVVHVRITPDGTFEPIPLPPVLSTVGS